MAAVVFDALAEAHFLHHFQVVLGAQAQALGFQQAALAFELGKAFFEFGADAHDGGLHFFSRGDKLLGGEEGVARQAADDFAGEGVNEAEAFDVVVEALNAQGHILDIGGHHFDDIPAGAKGAAFELDVVAFVEHFHEAADEGLAFHGLAGLQRDHHVLIILGGAQAVDAGYRGDDDGVGASQ